MKLSEAFAERFVTLKERPLIGLHSMQYCPAFCALFLKKMQEVTGLRVLYWDFSDEPDIHKLQLQLQTTFLGTANIFWLSDLSVLDQKSQKEIGLFLQTYEGPHTVCFFVPTDLKFLFSEAVMCLEISKIASADVFYLINSLLNESFVLNKTILKWLAQEYKGIQVDTACMLLQHAQVIDQSMFADAQKLLNEIAKPQASLFLLSQYFFSQQPRYFFPLWKELSEQYTIPFWIAFWSEQLWQAYHFIDLSKQSELSQARSIATRLPFSFFKQDSKKYSLAELHNAHNFIYNVDCKVKSGSHFPYLELFFAKFFSKSFVGI